MLVNQKDPEALAKAIERILSDGKLKRTLIENSKVTVKEFYPENIASKYLELISKIIKE